MNRPTQTILHSGKFLAFIKEGHWEYVNRVNATGAALILAVTAEQKILLVEQYRIPVHARTIELPAGIIGDEPGCSKESQAEAAEISVSTLAGRGRASPRVFISSRRICCACSVRPAKSSSSSYNSSSLISR